ncbi:hypothetical protein NECAME_15710, partial [Necator americanus]
MTFHLRLWTSKYGAKWSSHRHTERPRTISYNQERLGFPGMVNQNQPGNYGGASGYGNMGPRNTPGMYGNMGRTLGTAIPSTSAVTDVQGGVGWFMDNK